MSNRNRPAGITALGLFFLFGAMMSGVAAVALMFPGSALEALWRLNPHARGGFAAMGFAAVFLMAAVCAACTTAAIGLWRCTRWGYSAAVALLSVNLLGDLLNALIARDWRTLIGLPIGGAMIAYLLTKRRLFAA